MYLSKQIYLNQIQVVIHSLLLVSHFLQVFCIGKGGLAIALEWGKVEGERLLEVYEGNLLVAFYQLGLQWGGGDYRFWCMGVGNWGNVIGIICICMAFQSILLG